MHIHPLYSNLRIKEMLNFIVSLIASLLAKQGLRAAWSYTVEDKTNYSLNREYYGNDYRSSIIIISILHIIDSAELKGHYRCDTE